MTAPVASSPSAAAQPAASVSARPERDDPTPQAHCLFAVATADITPPVGSYHRMWGAATHERSEGVHRPLQAAVFALAPPPTSALARGSVAADSVRFVAVLDHCLFGAGEIARLRDRVTAQSGVPSEQLSITFTHTHGAGLMSLDRTALPGGEMIPAYLDSVAQTVATLVARCQGAAIPARIVYAPGLCTLARNRDFWDEAAQQWVCGFNPQGAIDPRFWTARVHDAEGGRPLATLVNYACHPTTLAWENRLISPDYIGALRETVQAYSGGAPCLFLQGASAELGPREGFVGDPAVADRNGRELAFASLSALATTPPPGQRLVYRGPVVSGATLGDWRYAPLTAAQAASADRFASLTGELLLSYRPELPAQDAVAQELLRCQQAEAAALTRQDAAAARDARAQVERHTRLLRRLSELPPQHYRYRWQALRVGDAAWLFLPGELYSDVFRALQARFPGRPLLIATLLDGWGPSYLPPRALYGSGRYQETIAVAAAGSLEQIIAAAGDALEQLFRE